MPQPTHKQKQAEVNAVQFFEASTPWPVPVHNCSATFSPELRGRPHVHNGMEVGVNDTDWIVTDVYTGLVRVIPNAQFSSRFEPDTTTLGAEPQTLPDPPLPDAWHHLR